jgi:hypothetical protein
LNEAAIVFIAAGQQHREVKLPSLSYEDDYEGNAVAGQVTPQRVEIRWHPAYSDERIRILWRLVRSLPELANAKFGTVYYQGREIY